jgi:hypothetical protein
MFDLMQDRPKDDDTDIVDFFKEKLKIFLPLMDEVVDIERVDCVHGFEDDIQLTIDKEEVKSMIRDFSG